LDIIGKVNLKKPKCAKIYTLVKYFSAFQQNTMKMARIFQQCANCFEKESSVDTVAGLANRFGT
jgi:hypothetical protein